MDNHIIAICPIVHGFVQAVYNVMEEEGLNTRFQLNVKGMTNFPGVLNIQGVITSLAGGTASEFILLYMLASFPLATLRMTFEPRYRKQREHLGT